MSLPPLTHVIKTMRICPAFPPREYPLNTAIDTYLRSIPAFMSALPVSFPPYNSHSCERRRRYEGITTVIHSVHRVTGAHRKL